MRPKHCLKAELIGRVIAVCRNEDLMVDKYSNYVEEIKAISVFPTISDEEVETILNKIDNNIRISDAIQGSSFDFPTAPDILRNLINNPCLTKSDYNFSYRFFACTYISWISYPKEEVYGEILHIIIQAIIFFMKDDKNDLMPEILKLTLTLFTNDINKNNFQKMFPYISAYYTQTKDYTYQALQLLVDIIHVLISSVQDVYDDSTVQMLQFLYYLIKDHGLKMPQEIANQLVPIVAPFIVVFDSNVVGYSSLLLGCAEESLMVNVYNSLWDTYHDLFNQTNFKLNLNLTKITDEKTFVPPNIIFIQTNFEGRFDMNNYPKIRETDNFNLDPTIHSKNTILTRGLASSPEHQKLFISHFTKSDKQLDEVLYVILDVWFNISSPNRIPISDIILKTTLFQGEPCISIDKSSARLSALRSLAFGIILEEGSLDALIEQTIYQHSFVEVAQRCMKYIAQVTNHTKGSNMPVLLGQALLSQRERRIAGDRNAKVETAVTMKLISMLLRTESVADSLFSSQYFASVYLSLAFEQPMAFYVIAELSNYFTTTYEDPIQLGIALSEAIRFAIDSGTSVLPLLKMVNGSPKYPNSFKGCIDLVEELMKSADVPLFNECLKFCASIADSVRMPNSIFKVIDERAKQIADENTHQLLLKLASHNAGGDNTVFQIKEVEPLLTHLQLLVRQGNIEKLCITTIGFCEVSDTNISKLHSAKVDSILLNIVKERWYDRSFSNALCELLLSAFFRIAAVETDVTAVTNFISLLDFEDGKPSPHLKSAFDSLFFHIQSTSKNPVSSMPIISKTRMTVNSAVDVTNGFTLVSYYFAPKYTPGYTPIIISMIDDGARELVISVVGSHIRVSDSLENPTHFANPEVELLHESWNVIAIHYHKTEEAMVVDFWVNGSSVQTVPLLPKQKVNGLVSLGIGGVLPNSDEPECPAFFGPVGLYPSIPISEIENNVKIFPRNLSVISEKPHFALRSFSGTGNSQNFLSIMIRRCSPAVFYPLFLKFNTVLDDIDIHDYTVRLLTKLLVLCEDAEAWFASGIEFSVINYLLRKQKMTYYIFRSFCGLLEVTPSASLRTKVLDHILLDFHLWRTAHLNDQIQIFMHISNDIMPNYIDIVIKFCSFSEFLCRFLSHISEKDLPNALSNVPSEMLTSLSKILNTIARKELTEDDYLQLMKFAVAATAKSSLAFLQIALGLIEHAPRAVEKIVGQPLLILAPMQFLVNHNSTEVAAEAVALVIRLSVFLKKPTLSECLSVLHHQLPVMNQTRLMFDKCITLYRQGFTECFGFLCLLCNTLGQECAMILCKEIKPSHELFNQLIPLLHGILLCTNLSSDARSRIFALIVSSGPSFWPTVFGLIEILSDAIDVNEDVLKCCFTEQVIAFMEQEKNQTQENLKMFAALIKAYLFQTKKPSLVQAFADSPFSNTAGYGYTHAQSTPHMATKTFEDILRKIESVVPRTRISPLRIRLDANSRWTDRTIALKALKILTNISCDTSISTLCLMISYLLLRSDSDSVCSFLKTYTPQNDPTIQALIDSIVFLGKLLNITTPVDGQATDRILDRLSAGFGPINKILPLNSYEAAYKAKVSFDRFSKSMHNILLLEFKQVAHIDIASWQSVISEMAEADTKNLYTVTKHWREICDRISVGNYPLTVPKGIIPSGYLGFGPFPSFQKPSTAIVGSKIIIPEKYIRKAECEIETNRKIENGTIFVTNDSIILSTSRSKVFLLSNIESLLHHENTMVGISARRYFMCRFENTNALMQIFEVLAPKAPRPMSSMTELWAQRKVCTFRYLVFLNFSTGRGLTMDGPHAFFPSLHLDSRGQSIRDFAQRMLPPSKADIEAAADGHPNMKSERELPVEAFTVIRPSSFEEIIRGRAALESNLVSKYLPGWITANFPSLWKDKTHPIREIEDQPQSQRQLTSVLHRGRMKVLFSDFSKREKLITIMYTDYSLIRFSVNKELTAITATTSFNLPRHAIEEHRIYSAGDGRIMFIGRDGRIFDGVVRYVSNDTCCAAVDHESFVAAGERLEIFKTCDITRPIASHPLSFEVAMAAVDSVNGIIPLITADGYLVIADMSARTRCRNPQKIGIPRNEDCLRTIVSLGLVVVFVEKEMVLFNTCAEEVFRANLGIEVHHALSAIKKNGNDVLYVSDSEGRLYMVDLLAIVNGNMKMEPMVEHGPISSISYSRESDSIVVVTLSGHIIIDRI